MSKWFVMQNDRVTGPYGEHEIKSQLAGGQFSPEDFIWGRSMPSWQAISWWMKELPQMTATAERAMREQMWHYAVEGDARGPLTRQELINELKNLRNKTEILVWTKGMSAWADLFEFHDLLDELGINRREHPRAMAEGSVVLKYDDKTAIGTLKSISPGGFGAAQLSTSIPMGQPLTVEIKSAALGEVLITKAVVQYVSTTGFCGFKFQGIGMEFKSRIMDYIKSRKSSNESTAA